MDNKLIAEFCFEQLYIFFDIPSENTPNFHGIQSNIAKLLSNMNNFISVTSRSQKKIIALDSFLLQDNLDNIPDFGSCAIYAKTGLFYQYSYTETRSDVTHADLSYCLIKLSFLLYRLNSKTYQSVRDSEGATADLGQISLAYTHPLRKIFRDYMFSRSLVSMSSLLYQFLVTALNLVLKHEYDNVISFFVLHPKKFDIKIEMAIFKSFDFLYKIRDENIIYRFDQLSMMLPNNTQYVDFKTSWSTQLKEILTAQDDATVQEEMFYQENMALKMAKPPSNP